MPTCITRPDVKNTLVPADYACRQGIRTHGPETRVSSGPVSTFTDQQFCARTSERLGWQLLDPGVFAIGHLTSFHFKKLGLKGNCHMLIGYYGLRPGCNLQMNH